MSPSHSPKAYLDARADTPSTEIFVMDKRFVRVGSAPGALHCELPPGMYVVKFKSGATTEEKIVELVAGQTSHVAVDSMVECAMPLKDGSAPQLAEIARDISLRPQRRGGTSSAFIFVREKESDEHPGRGIELLHSSGESIADLELSAERVAGDGYTAAALHVELAPGAYRLRYARPQSDIDRTAVEQTVIEQTVITVPGWQTAVFMSRSDEARGAIDSDDTAVIMNRIEYGFRPENYDIPWTEAARRALSAGRPAVTRELVLDMISRKLDNPMLGIFGAHLLLLAPELDRELLHIISDNVRELIGDGHPDMHAVALRLGENVPAVFAEPPMLRNSWTAVVAASAERPDLVPYGSLSYRAASRLWTGGVWMLWKAPDRDATQTASDAAPYSMAHLAGTDLQGLIRAVDHQIGERSGSETWADHSARWLEKAQESAGLDEIELSVLGSITGASMVRQSKRHNYAAEELNTTDLIGRLQLPRRVIDNALAGLTKKICG